MNEKAITVKISMILVPLNGTKLAKHYNLS